MPLFQGLFGPPDIEKMTLKLDMKGLIKVLDSSKYGVELCKQAMEAIVSIGDPAVEPLIFSLNESNGNIRANAALALGAIKNQRAVKPLISALDEKINDKFIRQDVAKALGMLQDARAINPLCDAAMSDNCFVIVPILEEFGDAGVTALLDRLNSRDSSERSGAAYALGYLRIQSNQARRVMPLIAALQDEDSGVRIYAASTLCSHSNGEMQGAVEKAIQDACSAEQDAHTRLHLRACLNQFDEDYRSEASYS
jgi:HEAT repeat protein